MNKIQVFKSNKLSNWLWLLLLIFAVAIGAAAQKNVKVAAKTTTYNNPVIAGDYPDPSVIRVGADYYATATSSEWSPEFQILHSRDLVNWNIVGDVFPKRPTWSAGNYWAPEIWQDNGKFYVFYVGRKKDGPLCIASATAAKATGPYTDHGALICQEAGSIDASAIRDENGKLFVVWKEDGNSVNKPTLIWAQQFDDKTYKLIGEKQEILRNDRNTWEAQLVEGPYILRRDGWFYLFYSGAACCTKDCNYALGVARSRTLLGNYEKNPANPILKGNEDWRCPGHGSIVTDEQDRTFLLYHAYDARDTVFVGRQALLDEVRFTDDNWATINDGRGPSKSAISPFNIAQRANETKFYDDFKTPILGWQWQHNNVPNYRLQNGFLLLSPNADNAKNEIGAIFARSTLTGTYAATTQIDASNLAKNVIVGIAAYGDNENALGAGVKDGKLIVWKRERNKQEIVASEQIPARELKNLTLIMTARDGHFYTFAMMQGRRIMPVGGELDGAYLPPWDRGVRVALTTGGANDAIGRFRFLEIKPISFTNVIE